MRIARILMPQFFGTRDFCNKPLKKKNELLIKLERASSDFPRTPQGFSRED